MAPVPPRQATGVPAALLVGSMIALLAMTSVWLFSRPDGQRRLNALSSSNAPARGIGSAKLRRALLRTGMLALYPAVESSRGGSSQDCADLLIGVGPADPARLPSNEHAPAEWRDSRSPGLPGLSLVLDPCRWRRLLSRPLAHGRDTEEVAWVSIFEGGAVRHASAVGVRIHGGSTRRLRPPSLRLYARPEYGSEKFPATLLEANGPEGAAGFERLILNRDEFSDRRRRRWLFPEAITYDVARRLGARVPATRVALLSLAGEAPWAVVLTEAPGRQALERRFPGDRLESFRLKRPAGSPDDRRRLALLRQIRTAPAPLSMAWADDRFDLEELLSGISAALICGTGEPFQGMTFRDTEGRLLGGRWTWLQWDLDQSFSDPPHLQRRGGRAIGDLFARHGAGLGQPAALLTSRLLNEEPRFRARLARRLRRALDQQATPSFLATLVARYAEFARRAGIRDQTTFSELARFFAARPAHLRQQISEVLD